MPRILCTCQGIVTKRSAPVQTLTSCKVSGKSADSHTSTAAICKADFSGSSLVMPVTAFSFSRSSCSVISGNFQNGHLLIGFGVGRKIGGQAEVAVNVCVHSHRIHIAGGGNS